MDKNYEIKKYIGTVKENNDFFTRFYYHSIIDLNLIKLDQILQNGILSKRLIERKNLASIYTHSGCDFDSKNGTKYISLTRYTNKCEFSTMFESFPLHTMTSLSIMVSDQIEVTRQGERETFFDDEVFCLDSIDKDKIKGIILPEHLSNMKIKEINCLPNDLSCYTRSYINNWLKCIEEYFNMTIPNSYISELKTSFEQLWDIIEEYESPEKWIVSAIKTQRKQYGKDIKDVLASILHHMWSLKYRIENPQYLDIITLLNQENLPIYEIQEKTLKKIN